ncbi:SET and MYND domain-containing protein 3 [Kappamyces sp. JEL0680]|nr:SET and MYND domain-containing protein 3 [Kappamyces sp. JEL0680]
MIARKHDPVRGVFLEAIGAVHAGQVLWREEAWVACMAQESVGLFCHYCVRHLEKEQKAVSCRYCSAKYCSLQCRQHDCSSHECELMRTEAADPITRLLARCCRLIKKDPSTVSGVCHDGRLDTRPEQRSALQGVACLISNAENYSQRTKDRFAHMVALVQTRFDPEGAIDPRLLLHLAHVLANNCGTFRCSFGEDELISTVLAVEYSLMNHSCRPAVSFAWDGKTLTVFAIRDIQKGEEITHSFIEPFQPGPARRQQLWNDYFFHCQCPFCSGPLDPLMAVVCPHCRLQYNSGSPCPHCGRSLETLDEEAVAEQLAAASPSAVMERLAQHLALYSPTHHSSILFCRLALDSLALAAAWKEARQVALDLARVFSSLLGPYWSESGLFLYEAWQYSVFLGQTGEDVVSLGTRALQVLQTTHCDSQGYRDSLAKFEQWKAHNL